MKSLIPLGKDFNSQVRHNLAVDTLSASFFALFAGAIYPFLAAVAVQLGALEWEIGLLVAAPFIGQIFTIYWGHLCQNKTRKLPFIVAPGVFCRLLIIPLAFMNNATFFISLVFLHHLIGAIAFPAFTGLTQKMYPLTVRGRLMGMVRFVYGLFHVLSTAVAGLLIDGLGFSKVFIIAAVIGMMGSLYFSRIKEPLEKNNKGLCRKFSFKVSLNLLLNRKEFALFIAGVSFIELGNMMVQPALPLYWINVLGLTSSQVGQISIFTMGFWFLSAPLWGSIIDKTRPIISVYGSVVFYALIPLIYLSEPQFYLVLVAASCLGLGMAGYEAGWSNHLMRLGRENSTSYVGLYLSLTGLRGLIAPFAGAFILAKWGREAAFITPFIIIILAFIFLIVADRKEMGEKIQSPLEELAVPE